jgi:hypothetical protein
MQPHVAVFPREQRRPRSSGSGSREAVPDRVLPDRPEPIQRWAARRNMAAVNPAKQEKPRAEQGQIERCETHFLLLSPLRRTSGDRRHYKPAPGKATEHKKLAWVGGRRCARKASGARITEGCYRRSGVISAAAARTSRCFYLQRSQPAGHTSWLASLEVRCPTAVDAVPCRAPSKRRLPLPPTSVSSGPAGQHVCYVNHPPRVRSSAAARWRSRW